MSLWGIGGGMVIFLAGLQGMPEHLYEAAKIDGAGPVRAIPPHHPADADANDLLHT